MSDFKAIGSLAVRVVSTPSTDEVGLGVDVDGSDVLITIPAQLLQLRLDADNARRLYEFLGTAIPLASKDVP